MERLTQLVVLILLMADHLEGLTVPRQKAANLRKRSFIVELFPKYFIGFLLLKISKSLKILIILNGFIIV
jgi:hypothetical protein